MKIRIPCYASAVSPLHHLMEECYKLAGKRPRRAVSKIGIIDIWNSTHSKSFKEIRNHLENAITLAFPKENYTRCLFTDASDDHWAAVLT